MKISASNALKATELFLEKYYFKNKSDDLGLLLSDISTNTFIGSETADSAAWEDWQDAIIMATGSTAAEFLNEQQAFNAMINFIRTFGLRIKSQEIEILLNKITTGLANNKSATDLRQSWMQCLNKAQKR